MRETDFRPVVDDQEIATYLQHVLTIDIPVRAAVNFERDRFGELVGIKGPRRAERKLVSLDCVLAVFGGRASVLFIYLLIDGSQFR